MQVKDLMTKDIHALKANASLGQARQLMEQHRIRQIPVIDGDNAVVGIVTKKDVYAASISSLTQNIGKRQEILEQGVTVAEIMTADPVTIGSEERVSAAASQLLELRVGALPVTEGNKLVGLISGTDVLAVAVQLLEEKGS
ncbi:CBS domain-containing protein [Maricurvus nonylphenolicus]|uniref:CBS domain-containing protein n=1 Tax=Maricurvus nonylphenolicus TaxID=1008307 RepID=UPI0036F41ABD